LPSRRPMLISFFGQRGFIEQVYSMRAKMSLASAEGI
jgi:hypothetical protein